MITQQPVLPRTIYIQNTTNQSFIDMHNHLKATGIKNNSFFLVLLDPMLNGVNPRDPRLSIQMKQRIFRECAYNYWYFIRECVRIPDQGGAVNSGIPYKLHRGNLALNYCLMLNLNVFAEFPRQHGKTIAVICRILWEFLFGTRNSEIAFLNKKHEDSKLNLLRLKDIRKALPEYLQMDSTYGINNQKLKPKNSAEALENAAAGNKIKTFPAAPTPAKANQLGRGCTQPRQWYDEYAFIQNNKTIYLSATPAYSKAAENARKNKAPYGIIITTTPGILTTPEGKEAFDTKEAATKFSETWYDLSAQEVYDLMSKNTSSNFVYIRYTYKELGGTEAWFAKIVKDMKKDWDAIRREVLLEWSESSDNSPFTKEDLEMVGRKIKNPISTMVLRKYYTFNIYEQLRPDVVPIIGVDVSGGLQRDSSAITIVDSSTTKVVADFNCNYISPLDLARVIYELVSKYLPNAVVIIERNGGFGASVLKSLLKTSIKPNIYYEIKERVIEERYNGENINKFKKLMKVYGFDNTNKSREGLMEILRQRMDSHKDKFVSPIIYNELKTLELKTTRSGSVRIDHSANGHDDQLFSYLLALYVWYEGKDLANRWNIRKSSITTDDNCMEDLTEVGYGGRTDITQEVVGIVKEDENDQAHVQQQLEFINSDKSKLYSEFVEQQKIEDQKQLQLLLQYDKLARKAYCQKYSKSEQDLEMEMNLDGNIKVPDKVFEDFYN